MNQYVLEVNQLSKQFDSHFSLEDISFQVKPGYIVGVIGENGAGRKQKSKRTDCLRIRSRDSR